ncbi:hypothetical protein JZ751_002986 [Albula glossodonta]|uniref:Uncharacterized protein n=1 Tax=Albula glossodonta TaxID=121402 RepID=A0A8T2N8G5_9TELE|nr:hypothetical protein JZ751_002986 [Albula glossodonta]
MKSDVEELMPRLLPVEKCETGEVDLSGPPRNPQEYLRQVQSLCYQKPIPSYDNWQDDALKCERTCWQLKLYAKA